MLKLESFSQCLYILSLLAFVTFEFSANRDVTMLLCRLKSYFFFSRLLMSIYTSSRRVLSSSLYRMGQKVRPETYGHNSVKS